jgi:hypothetical protein
MARRAPRTIPHRGTRVRRADATGPDRLESISAAFALLAQRRARLMRQIDLLDRQQSAARASLEKVEAKLGELGGYITAQSAAEAVTAAPAAQSPPAPAAVPLHPRQPAQPGPGTAQRRSRSIILTY